MTRIIAGSAGGRRLAVPGGDRTRPTADRAREGLFSSLQSSTPSLAGLRFADLYAGSGAVGLEALSRGAAAALLVEHDPGAARTLRANVETLGLPGAEVLVDRVERLASARPSGPAYDVVFLDPPYDLAATALAVVVADLARHGWLAPGALLAVERATRDGEWHWPEAVQGLRSRRYGEATFWYGRAADPPEPSPGE